MVTLPGAKSRYAAGERAGDFLAKAADSAADFACGLYRDFPGALINPVPIPLRDVGSGFMDSLCGKRQTGLPPSPNPKHTGGQCPCVSYTVTFTRTVTNANGTTSTSTSTGTYPGEIKGLQKLGRPGDPGFYDWRMLAGNENCPVNALAFGRIAENITFAISGVVPVNGQPDTCGNPPKGFPDAVIPPSRTTGDVTIVKDDGLNLTIPIVYAPITPTLEISPRFNFDLGGLQFSFDAGGVTINNALNPSDPINRDYLPPGTGDVINNIGGDVTNLGDNITNLGDTINNINDVVNDIKDSPCECPEFNPDEIVPDPKTENDPKEEEGDPTIESVEVTLTSVPRNARSQSGSDAPDVVYAGWFEWKRGEFCFPREPIHFEQSIFKNLVSADGFAYTVYEGFRAKHTVNRIPDEPV